MYYGALEAGGTKMVCAIGDADKNIIDRISIPTGTPDQSVPAMIDYFKKYDISALGIGTFGPADINPNSPTYGSIMRIQPLQSIYGCAWLPGCGGHRRKRSSLG